MNTYLAKNGTIFYYNSDHSGETVISVHVDGRSPEESMSVEVNGEDLLEFGKKMFVTDIISVLENIGR